MESICNRFKRLYPGITPHCLADIENLESDYYKLKNQYADLKEELDEYKNQDSNALTNISRKLSKVIKSDGTDAMISEMQLHRTKIIDHFTMAYMSELNLKPSEIKLVQGVNEDGYVELFFEKHSDIILPGQ